MRGLVFRQQRIRQRSHYRFFVRKVDLQEFVKSDEKGWDQTRRVLSADSIRQRLDNLIYFLMLGVEFWNSEKVFWVHRLSALLMWLRSDPARSR